MEWLQKVDKRKSNAKTDDPLRPEKTDREDNELVIGDSEDEDEDETGTGLPEPSKAQANVIDQQSAKQLQSNPAMDGAIPIAIFDISRKQPFFTADTAEQFFFMFASFSKVSVQPRIAQHVLETLDKEYPKHPSTANCHIRQPIISIDPLTAEFPRALRDVLGQLKTWLDTTDDVPALEAKTASWMDEYLAIDQLDEGIRKVLEHTRKGLTTV